MNKSWILAAALALVASPALAADDHDAHHPAQQKQKTASGAGATSADFQQHMQKMQALMDKLRATQDPQQRQKLMQEHAQLMQEGMKMERMAIANCPMMGEGGMDMMQMMMDHMRQRESMMGQGMMGGMKMRGGTAQ